MKTYEYITISIMVFIFGFYAITIIAPIADGDFSGFIHHITVCSISLFAITYTLKEGRK